VAGAVSCLDAAWKEGHRYQKGCILLVNFFSQGVAQLDLFEDTAPRANATALMDILDSVNQRNGRGTLFFAGQGIEKKWQMKREMLSPRWTTRLKDVPRVF
jgi:DNA polymerase V